MDLVLLAIALSASFCFALGLVLTQFGLRFLTPAQGACISVPTTAALFLLAAPWTMGADQWEPASFAIFVAAGVLFPAFVTLLNFESNKRIGPNLTGALGNLSPAFAVGIAVVILGETPDHIQLIAIIAVCLGVALLFIKPGQSAQRIAIWMLALPVAAACIRGVVQPVVKLGLTAWPNPFAATTIGYCVSALAIGLFAISRRINPRRFHRVGIFWFVIIAAVNGSAVFLLYAALARGPVTIVAPIVACYPVITMILNRILRGDRALSIHVAAGVSITVFGIGLLLIS